LKTGVPHAEIVGAAAEEHADLIVIGRTGAAASIAPPRQRDDRVVRLAPCPVVTVRVVE